MPTLFARCLFWLCALLMGALLLLAFPAQTLADGGAPNLAYVSGTARGVGVIDIARQQISDTVAVDGGPRMILLSVDGRALYVARPEHGDVAIIATKTKQIICTLAIPGRPDLLALDPGTDVLYAAGSGASEVTSFDPLSCAVRQRLSTPGPVYGLAVALIGGGLAGGSGNQIWVAGPTSLSAFDSSGKRLASISLPQGPRYLCIPQGSTTIYATTALGGVLGIDLKRYRVVTLVESGASGPMDYDAATGEVYVPDGQHNRLDVLTPYSIGAPLPREPGRTIELAAAPQAIAITSDGQFGFAALANGDVAMLDIPGRQLVNTFHVGGTPHFIVTGLYPSALSLTPQQASFLSILVNYSHYIAGGAILLAAGLAIWRERRMRAKMRRS